MSKLRIIELEQQLERRDEFILGLEKRLVEYSDYCSLLTREIGNLGGFKEGYVSPILGKDGSHE